MYDGKIIILKIDDESERLLNKILDVLSKDQYQLTEISTSCTLSFADLQIDLAAKRVIFQNIEIALTYYEYHVLCYLARHAGCILTKKQIYEAVWDDAR